MGAATAYFLSALGGGRLTIEVSEPDPTYARAATALAAGGIRQQFSTPENVLMSQFGYRFLEEIGETLAVGGERPDVGLTPRPYLRLAPADARERLRAQVALQCSLGAGSSWLEPSDVGARYPWMSLAGVSAAVLGGRGEGTFDPYTLLQALRRKSQASGARYRPAAVIGMGPAAEDGAIGTLRLGDGSDVAFGVVVNAAGPRAASVAAMAGLDLPVEAIKAHSFVFRAEDPVRDCPIVLDQVLGLQLKPEGELFVCAVPRADPAAGPDDFDVDHDLFEAEAWPRLVARVPQFDRLRLIRAWVGHVERNRLDGNPILGLHPERPNVYFITGFSGHGAQHIPAAGRAIAELILFGEYRSLDLSRLGWDRVIRAEPLAEGV